MISLEASRSWFTHKHLNNTQQISYIHSHVHFIYSLLCFISITGDKLREYIQDCWYNLCSRSTSYSTWFKFLEMSSYQNIKIFIVNKKNLNQVIFVCIFDKYCMYRQFTSYIFFNATLFYYSALLFFLEKQVAICTTTAQYLFKVWALILNQSLEKAPGKGWPLLTLQVRQGTIVAREFIPVVRWATIVALPRRSLFTSISRSLRRQLKAVLQELVAAAFL